MTKLIDSVLINPEHTLNKLLPDRRHKLTYTPRHRRHDLTLGCASHCLFDRSFVVRQLFKDSY